jgi:heat-inducible transcriptional repressor
MRLLKKKAVWYNTKITMTKPMYKAILSKKLPKNDREQAVLLGLIELYLKMGKPIGSSTLQESGFESLSSATIRNYFSKMEESGYLKQQHTSGGRIPTEKAFRLYADIYKAQGHVEEGQEEMLSVALKREDREVATLINRAADLLSEMTKCAVFLSTPRFDQDFVQDIRLIKLDDSKLLAVVITDFGLVRTESIYLDYPIGASFLESAEEYFLWRMSKGEKPLFRDEAEAKLAQRIYNEVMVRHVVGTANFSHEEILRTGLSKLLSYPEFNDAAALASSLSLLEDEPQMRSLLRECCKKNELIYWIGDDLCPSIPPGSECAVLAIPYRINQTIAGAIALLGPTRIPYRNLIGLSRLFSDILSRALTESIYKYKITFRQPKAAGEIAKTSILLEKK